MIILINLLKEILDNYAIEDIYVFGFVENEDGIYKFHQDLRQIYFEVNNNYIEVLSLEDGLLRIKITDKMDYYFKYNLIEEDFSVCISSIFNMVTYGEGTIAKAENIILYNYSEIKDNIICNALEINFMNRDVIFMDPLYIHGIGIGGIEQKNFWLRNHKDTDTLNVKVISF